MIGTPYLKYEYAENPLNVNSVILYKNFSRSGIKIDCALANAMADMQLLRMTQDDDVIICNGLQEICS